MCSGVVDERVSKWCHVLPPGSTTFGSPYNAVQSIMFNSIQKVLLLSESILSKRYAVVANSSPARPHFSKLRFLGWAGYKSSNHVIQMLHQPSNQHMISRDFFMKCDSTKLTEQNSSKQPVKNVGEKETKFRRGMEIQWLGLSRSSSYFSLLFLLDHSLPILCTVNDFTSFYEVANPLSIL